MQPPPDLLRLARLHRARQQQLAAAAAREVHRPWSALGPARLAQQWQQIAGLILRTVTGYQREAARGAADYVASGLRLTGAGSDPAGRVPESAFAGIASDGRDLAGLLDYPAFEVSAFIDGGMDGAQALDIGGRHMDRIVATQIQDAARISTGVAQVNDRRVTGYIRVLSPPSCSRCVILAGKKYRYNQGFARHPHCDCVHMPAAEVIEPQSPRAIFDAMSDQELAKAGWVAADVQAIRDGADIAQVTNAHLDLRSVTVAGQTVKTNLTGATRRGLAGQRLGAGRGARVVRLTPEQLYLEADRLGWSRDELIRQLTRFGYIL